MTSIGKFPPESSPGRRAGLELYELATAGDVSHGVIERRLRLIDSMLTSDPHSIFDFVPLSTLGTDGLFLAIRVRDDFRINLASAANDTGHFPVSSNA